MFRTFEIWVDTGEGNYGFEMLCNADSIGDAARLTLGPDARFIQIITAKSHFEAMTKYYEVLDWGVYTTEFEQDKQPFACGDRYAPASTSQG
jgi:hypothetical protein